VPWSASSLRLHVESALAGRVVSPFRFREVCAPVAVPAGIAALDELTGGLPRGCLTEICGPPGSGKTSILRSALAARTRAAEACALVDAQDCFDPAGAKKSGVELSRLLWVRCRGIDQALRCVDLLLHGGGFGLVALDLGDIPVRLVRQVQLNVWFRMRRAVEDTSTIFVVLTQETCAKSCASLVLRAEKEAATWSVPRKETAGHAVHTQGCLLDGSTHSVEMVRSFLRGKKPFFIDRPKSSGASETVHFQLSSDKQISEEESCEAEALPAAEVFEERRQIPG
jgi:recombination protein RecA